MINLNNIRLVYSEHQRVTSEGNPMGVESNCKISRTGLSKTRIGHDKRTCTVGCMVSSWWREPLLVADGLKPKATSNITPPDAIVHVTTGR